MSKPGVLLNIRFDVANKIAAFRAALPHLKIIDWSQNKLEGNGLNTIKYAWSGSRITG